MGTQNDKLKQVQANIDYIRTYGLSPDEGPWQYEILEMLDDYARLLEPTATEPEPEPEPVQDPEWVGAPKLHPFDRNRGLDFLARFRTMCLQGAYNPRYAQTFAEEHGITADIMTALLEYPTWWGLWGYWYGNLKDFANNHFQGQ